MRDHEAIPDEAHIDADRDHEQRKITFRTSVEANGNSARPTKTPIKMPKAQVR
jgi:hypothetical protein